LGDSNGFEVRFSTKNFLQKVEKKSILSGEYGAGALREKVPLKQGLKLFYLKCAKEFDVAGKRVHYNKG
jgi:hypothetical protein